MLILLCRVLMSWSDVVFFAGRVLESAAQGVWGAGEERGAIVLRKMVETCSLLFVWCNWWRLTLKLCGVSLWWVRELGAYRRVFGERYEISNMGLRDARGHGCLFEIA